MKLSEVATLPALSTEYKVENWTGCEVFPDEEECIREEAEETECFWLRSKRKEGGGRLKVSIASSTVFSSPQDTETINNIITDALVASYENLDKVELEIDNNCSSTQKYGVLQGSSREPICFTDHATPLYLVYYFSAQGGGATGTWRRNSASNPQLDFELQTVYLSSDRSCGMHRNFFG